MTRSRDESGSRTMQVHRTPPARVWMAFGVLLTACLVGPAGTAAQSASPSAIPRAIPVPSSSSDTMCGVDFGSPIVTIDGRTSHATPRYLVEDPAPSLAEDELDVISGQQLPLEIPSWSTDTPLERLPIDSLAATLQVGDDPVRWLATRIDGDTATITVPTNATGHGELAFRVGTCGSWSIAGRYPITVRDAAAAADCPSDQAGLEHWLESLDQRARLGGERIPSLGIVNIRDRSTGLSLHDSGSYAYLPYHSDTPVIQARAASRITLQPVDPGLEPASVEVEWLEVPPEAELRAGELRTLEPAGTPTRARRTGDGKGISVRVPTTTGRYLLSSSSDWQDRCVVSTETFTFAIVESR